MLGQSGRKSPLGAREDSLSAYLVLAFFTTLFFVLADALRLVAFFVALAGLRLTVFLAVFFPGFLVVALFVSFTREVDFFPFVEARFAGMTAIFICGRAIAIDCGGEATGAGWGFSGNI